MDETLMGHPPRRETYTFEHEGHTYVWDVTKAREIVRATPRDPDLFNPAEQGVTADHLRLRYPSLDWEYARTTDLSDPLLFVPFRGRAQLIDGWHRLARAVLEGVAALPAYLLTAEEAHACLIAHLLPSKVPSGSQWLPWREPDTKGRR